MLRSNSFEGGSDGTTITTGNSGGASGDAFDAVSIGASGTFKFSTVQEAHGALSAQIVEPGTGRAIRGEWTGLGGGSSNIYFRCYLWVPSGSLSNRIHFIGVRASPDALCSQMGLNTDGTLRVTNAAGTQVSASSSAPARDQWVRYELRVKASTTVGEVEWRYFNTPDSETATETASVSSQVLSANADAVRWGVVTTPAPTSITIYIDDLAVDTAGWIGPAGLRVPRSGSVNFQDPGVFAVRRGIRVPRLWRPRLWVPVLPETFAQSGR